MRRSKTGEVFPEYQAWLEDNLDREEHYEREKTEDMERWERYELTGQCIDQTPVT